MSASDSGYYVAGQQRQYAANSGPTMLDSSPMASSFGANYNPQQSNNNRQQNQPISAQ